MLLFNVVDTVSHTTCSLCIQEQAVEREHERDEFQQEIRRLEAQLRQSASGDNKGHRVRLVHFLASIYTYI